MVQLPALVIKRGIPIATAVRRDISLQAVRPLRPKLGQLPKFALAALLREPVISVRLVPIQVSVPATTLQAVR